MDYSKLTPEQLLEMLKNQSPELYSRINNYTKNYNVPITRALEDYQIPSMIRDGYDLNLFNEEIPFDDQASLGTITPFLYNTDVINKEFDNAPGYGFLYDNQFNFPSDYYNQDDLNDAIQGTTPYNNSPAFQSANFFNSLSDEDLLKLLLKKR